jgi:hypothetical protein
MRFSIYKWNRYRLKAREVGLELEKLKEANGGKVNMKDEAIIDHLDAITGILDECSNYMSKCGLSMPPTPWKYDPKDPTTHISSELFAYKELMHLI